MAENNFEKQVQQKMEGLQFAPSEPVWQKVALQIGKEKRKRRLIFILLPLLLLTGSAIWYATQSGSDFAVPAVSSNRIEQNKVPGKSQDEITAFTKNNDVPLSQTAQSKDKPAPTNAIAGRSTKTAQKGFETFLNKPRKTKKQQQPTVIPFPETKTEKSRINEELHALVLQNEIEKRTSALAVEKSAAEKNVSKPFWDSAAKKEEVAVLQPLHDSITNQTADNDVALEMTQKDTVVNDVEIPQVSSMASRGKDNKKWEWTITARAGASHLRSGMMNVFSPERADNLYAAPVFSNNPSTGSSGNNGAPTLASSLSGEINKSFAFGIGAGVRKKILGNAFVVTSLQYSRYSTNANAGPEVAIDTSVNYNGRSNRISRYYLTSGPQSKYTTHYHYLELPLAIEYRLFKAVPLQLQHGVSAGYLFATNALYYNPGAGILYNNNQWLRKLGLNVFTSADYRLLQAPSFSLFAGPLAQWSMAPMQQPREPKKHYLFFAGLQTRITF